MDRRNWLAKASKVIGGWHSVLLCIRQVLGHFRGDLRRDG